MRELRVLESSRSRRQGDAAIDNYGAQQQTALTDFVVRHPTAATSNYRYGQSGDTAKDAERYKEGKYGAAAEGVGILFIPFAMETYGKMGTKALRMLRTLQQDQADSNPTSALRPWHARSFVDSAVQRLSVALQRTIQRDQILRSHLRRVKRGGDAALDAYYYSGDGGYARGAASSSLDGGSVGFGGGGTPQVDGGGSASCCSGTPAPRSAGEGAGL